MNRRRAKRISARMLVIVPYLLALFILQAMVFPRVRIFGVKPLILPLAVAGAALFGGHVSGAAMGIFAGMLCDLSFNEPTVTFTVLLPLIGILFGLLSDTVLVQGFPSYLLCALGTLSVCAVCQIFPMFFFDRAAFTPLIRTAALQTGSSMIFSVPVYYIARFVGRPI